MFDPSAPYMADPFKFSVSLKGLKLDNVAREVQRCAADGLLKAGIIVLDDGKRMTPVDTGFLRNSGFVVSESSAQRGSGPQGPVDAAQGRARQSGRNKVEVYVGHSAEYAAAVHETPRADGKDRWLANSLSRNRRRIPQIVAETCKRRGR